MRRLWSWTQVALLAAAVAVGGPALAQAKKKATVGVFLPASISEGAARFEFGESFAKALEEKLGRPVAARNFGRFEDFSKAASAGMLDYAVVDGWVMAQAGLKLTPVASAQRAQDGGGRWAIVARQKVLVKDLQGKKLAVVRSPRGADAKFVSNAVFVGDLDARKHFKFVPVPDVESALKALEAKTVEAALLPAFHAPKGLHVIYRSAKLPGVVVAAVKGDADEFKGAVLGLGAVAPFEKLIPTQAEDVDALGQLVSRGPARRRCVMAESPLVRVDAKALIRFSEVGRVLPPFESFMDAPKEQPQD